MQDTITIKNKFQVDGETEIKSEETSSTVPRLSRHGLANLYVVFGTDTIFNKKLSLQVVSFSPIHNILDNRSSTNHKTLLFKKFTMNFRLNY